LSPAALYFPDHFCRAASYAGRTGQFGVIQAVTPSLGVELHVIDTRIGRGPARADTHVATDEAGLKDGIIRTRGGAAEFKETK
jgi:hypothetical protein